MSESSKNLLFCLFGMIISGNSITAQISDLRGGGALNVGTVRFYNIYSNLEGVYGNFAATSLSKNHFYADVSAILRYNDATLGEYSMAIVSKRNNNSFGVLLAQFGAQDYFERKLQLSYAKQLFDNGGLGLNFNLMNVQNKELGSFFLSTSDIFFFSKITKYVSTGTAFRNIINMNRDGLFYPRVAALSLFYHPSKVVVVGFEASKIIDRSFDIKMIVQYQPSPKVDLNFGLDILNQNVGLSMAYSMDQYRIGLASGKSNRLPMSSGISLGYLK